MEIQILLICVLKMSNIFSFENGRFLWFTNVKTKRQDKMKLIHILSTLARSKAKSTLEESEIIDSVVVIHP